MIALVTGGASCGKSAFAEQLCMQLGGKLVYLAAMQPFGEEGARRIRKHRAQRAGKGFETIECYENFGSLLDDERAVESTALLECLGNVVANELFSREHGCATADYICDVVEGLAARCRHLVIVGNEVGCDGVAYPHETHEYQEVLGDLARCVADRSDIVVEVVAGCPMVLKFDHDAQLDDLGELAKSWAGTGGSF